MPVALTSAYVRYPSPRGGVRAYLTRAADDMPRPALIVIHEWTGLIPYIEDVGRRLAREGYLALVPDLYTDDPVRADFTVDDLEAATDLGHAADLEAALQELPPDHRDRVRRAHEWRRGRPGASYVPDLQASLAYLQARPDVISTAIGAIGFCMGGRLAGTLATTGADLAAAVIFYGPIPPLDGVPNVRCPVEGHYGEEDPSVTRRVPELEAAMRAAGKEFTAFVYPGAPHAFHNDTRPSYTPAAAEQSWARALAFLDQHVKAPVDPSTLRTSGR
jgi:carboxymethylenebutenolidase